MAHALDPVFPNTSTVAFDQGQIEPVFPNLDPVSPLINSYNREKAIQYVKAYLTGEIEEQLRYTRLAGNADVWDICITIGRFIRAAQKYGWVPDTLLYFPAYPEENIRQGGGIQTSDTPHPKAGESVITWKVKYRKPASIDTQPGFEKKGRQPKKPYIRETLQISHEIMRMIKNGEDVPDNLFIPGSDDKNFYDIIEVETLFWDNLIRFDIFGKTNADAERICIAFEKMLYANTALFKKIGANQFLNWGRTEDPIAQNNSGSELRTFADKAQLKFRSVDWFIRTEEFHTRSIRSIQSIEYEIGVQ